MLGLSRCPLLHHQAQASHRPLTLQMSDSADKTCREDVWGCGKLFGHAASLSCRGLIQSSMSRQCTRAWLATVLPISRVKHCCLSVSAIAATTDFRIAMVRASSPLPPRITARMRSATFASRSARPINWAASARRPSTTRTTEDYAAYRRTFQLEAGSGVHRSNSGSGIPSARALAANRLKEGMSSPLSVMNSTRYSA